MYVAIIGLVVTIIAASVSAYASYEQGQTQKEIQKYNQKVNENRAIEERQRAQFDANRLREHNRRILANQRAVYGTTGVDVAEGSPLLVMADSAREAELDAQVVLSGGAARASDFEARARINRFEGDSAARAGNINAGTTLLAGAASGYRQYSGAQNSLRVPASSGWGSTQTPAYQSYRAGERD